MPLIAELITKLEVNQAAFSRQMSLAEGDVGKFARNSGAAIAAVGAAVAALAITGFGTLLHYINKTSIEVDELAKRAHKLGTSVEAFQRLEYAAKLANVSTETLNSGLSRLVKNIGEAQKGIGPAADALKRLGLNAKDLQAMSLDKQYIAIANALKTVTNQNEQAQIAIKLFGRAGVEQLNLLRTNLTETSKEFDQLGIALSDKAAKGVEAYRDSITRLSAILDSFWVQLTAQISPALTSLNTFISDSIIKFGGLGPAANLAARYMIDGIILAAKGFQGFLDLLEAIAIKFKELHLASLAFFAGIGTKGLEGQIKTAESTLNKAYTQQAQGGMTAGLVKGLETMKDSIGGTTGSSKGKLDITVSADRGLKLDIAESPEITAKILEIYYRTTANAARTAGR